MKVLVADKFERSGLDGLKALGCDVSFEPDLKDDALTARLKELNPTVLVVRSTKVTAPMMDCSLGLIIRAGAGYNTIDVEAANDRGILVANCPGKNAHAVAELAIGLMLAVDRRIADNVTDFRKGVWNKAEYSKARGVYGRTLGIVGMGNIGQQVIPVAKALGMNVAVYSRWMTPESAAALGVGRAETLEELAAKADVVSVHVSLTPGTRGMLGKSFFESMKDGAIFINTSRAEVVDQAALEEALQAGKIWAGLDVFEGEPAGGKGEYSGSLMHQPRAFCTHHIGASTEEAQEAVAAETVRIVKEYMRTGDAPNVVNVRPAAEARAVLVVRHADRVGVLAEVLGVLKTEEINIQEMENIILGGARAAIAQMSLDKAPSSDCVHKIKLCTHVFDACVLSA